MIDKFYRISYASKHYPDRSNDPIFRETDFDYWGGTFSEYLEWESTYQMLAKIDNDDGSFCEGASRSFVYSIIVGSMFSPYHNDDAVFVISDHNGRVFDSRVGDIFPTKERKRITKRTIEHIEQMRIAGCVLSTSQLMGFIKMQTGKHSDDLKRLNPYLIRIARGLT